MSESNNNTPMRITQLEEATAYEDGMYYAVAKAGYGTKKISQDVPNGFDFDEMKALGFLNNTFNLTEDDWELGGLSVTIGSPLVKVSNSIRLRLKKPLIIKTVSEMTLIGLNLFNVNLILLDENQIAISQSGYTSKAQYITTYGNHNEAYYIQIVLRDHTDATLTIDDCENLSMTYNYNRFKFQGFLMDLGVTKIRDLADTGWYSFNGAYKASITDLPADYPSAAGTIEVLNPCFANSGFRYYKLYDPQGHIWVMITQNMNVFTDWTKIGDSSEAVYNLLKNKNVAILGDSISTNGTDGDFPNVPEITVQAADVGVELKAYLTYYDVQGGLSLGGHTFTSDEIGTEVTFTPTNEDVGKKIGVPYNYNSASTVVWWEVMKEQLGFNPIPACWSGSSITSHEGNTAQYKTSYAWHEAQIRKCGIRTAGTMNRTAPDVVFIYRGTNDFSHSPYTLLTDNYFDNYNWTYPENDSVSGGYGYKEGLCLTIKKIRDAYPNAKIFLCTLNVFKRINYSHFPTNNGINSLPQYNDAIREVANFMGCGVINFDQDGITFENCYSQGYITDSATIPTHPSNKGHKAMGLKAIADIKAQYSNMT